MRAGDLIEALELDSEESVTRFDRETGRTVMVDSKSWSAFEEGTEDELGDLPDWQEQETGISRAAPLWKTPGSASSASPTSSNSTNTTTWSRFIGTVDDAEAAEQLWRAIKGKGAFRYFKDTARRLGLLERWYRYRDSAMKRVVLSHGAEASDIPFEDDIKDR